jgi:hypothetical protein
MPHTVAVSAGSCVQVPDRPPWQQPVEQLFRSHVHAPVVVSHAPFEHWASDVHGTHAPLAQTGDVPPHAVGAPHEPLELQISTALPLHCVVPGSHATHPPFRHTAIGAAQVPQVAPLAPHAEGDSIDSARHVPLAPPLQQPPGQV